MLNLLFLCFYSNIIMHKQSAAVSAEWRYICVRTEIKDPRINPMTSVVSVEVAPDLKTCKAYISVLGDEQSQQDTIKGLKSAEGYIRRQLARSINLRNTQEIKFILDQTIEYGVNMSHLIDEVTKHDELNHVTEAEEKESENED